MVQRTSEAAGVAKSKKYLRLNERIGADALQSHSVDKLARDALRRSI
jgi:hypothetical protein